MHQPLLMQARIAVRDWSVFGGSLRMGTRTHLDAWTFPITHSETCLSFAPRLVHRHRLVLELARIPIFASPLRPVAHSPCRRSPSPHHPKKLAWWVFSRKLQNVIGNIIHVGTCPHMDTGPFQCLVIPAAPRPCRRSPSPHHPKNLAWWVSGHKGRGYRRCLCKTTSAIS